LRGRGGGRRNPGLQGKDTVTMERKKEMASVGNELRYEQTPDGGLIVRLSGDWKLGEHLSSGSDVEKKLASGPPVRRILLDAQGLGDWDSGLLIFLGKVTDYCSQNKIQVDKEGLPKGVQRLMALASAVPERIGARKETKKNPFLFRVGGSALDFWRSALEILNFLGDATLSFFRLLRGKAAFRRTDLTLLLQVCGSDALPIVSLINFLVGLILGFVGAIELSVFGAQVYVADLVGIAMVRIMGALMTGIIISGRTGAAFAAQIGTMQVNEEIDALQTLGISPVDFLVLPRMLALIVMMPLLCIFADVLGILGGLVVAVGMLDVSVTQYLLRTQAALTLAHFGIGLFHGAVFGVLVALAGCLRGMQCGRSASAVGEATTAAVVTSIVAIIVATAIITFMCQVLGI
jgi:phospholipid/cholesterol/gamma-HCH transport system permease protein